jgi:hypothetical protein
MRARLGTGHVGTFDCTVAMSKATLLQIVNSFVSAPSRIVAIDRFTTLRKKWPAP